MIEIIMILQIIVIAMLGYLIYSLVEKIMIMNKSRDIYEYKDIVGKETKEEEKEDLIDLSDIGQDEFYKAIKK